MVWFGFFPQMGLPVGFYFRKKRVDTGGRAGHGRVWLGLARSCLFVSCLMCLHGVSVCRNIDGLCFLPIPGTSFEQKEGLRYVLLSSPSSDTARK